jgi:hypothetical protein
MDSGELMMNLDQLVLAISADQDKELRVEIQTNVHENAEDLEKCFTAIDSQKSSLK